MRPRLKPLLALAVLAVALACAAPAVAQQAPTLGEETTATPTGAPPDTTTSGDGGLKTWQEVLIFAAGLALIAGIGFAIVGDARERSGRLARSGRSDGTSADDGVKHKHRAEAKSRARAKGRAAKAARRKNR
jgi:hypothetical protein